MAQGVICYIAAIFLGLQITINIVYAVLCVIPVAMLYIALGLLCGSVLNDKQVGGICGALLTNLSAWLSGVWFDLKLAGGFFEKIACALPFVHAVEMEKALFRGEFSLAASHVMPVVGYGILITVLATVCFLEQINKQ